MQYNLVALCNHKTRVPFHMAVLHGVFVCHRDPSVDSHCFVFINLFFLLFSRLPSVILTFALLISSGTAALLQLLVLSRKLLRDHLQSVQVVLGASVCVCVFVCVCVCLFVCVCVYVRAWMAMTRHKGLNERTWMTLINMECWWHGLTSDTRTCGVARKR